MNTDLGNLSYGELLGLLRKDLQLDATTDILPGTILAALTSGGIYVGTGVPLNTSGNNGSFYFRSDGGAGTCLYQKRAGVWVATAA